MADKESSNRLTQLPPNARLKTIEPDVTVPLPNPSKYRRATDFHLRGDEVFSVSKHGVWESRGKLDMAFMAELAGPNSIHSAKIRNVADPHYQGVWPSEETLPEDNEKYLYGDYYEWRAAKWYLTPDGWLQDAREQVTGGGVPNGVTFDVSQSWFAKAQAQGFTGTYEEWRKKSYEHLHQVPTVTEIALMDTLWVRAQNNGFVGTREEWEKHNAEVVEREVKALLTPSSTKPAVSEEEIDSRLMVASDDDWHDKGAMARVLMETRKENKRLRRARLISRVFWSTVILAGIIGLGYVGYLYIMSSITTGRYTDERSCKVSKGNLTITGKRTFSYPYKTLFGFRLVDENKVLIDTVMNVTGDKITVTGLNGKKYWQTRAAMGERGIMILKDADTYLFQTDKDLIVATSNGFCNPIQRELDKDELKQPELDIIK